LLKISIFQFLKDFRDDPNNYLPPLLQIGTM